MSGTFFGFEIARRAIQTNRMGMDVTGNNVANANTPGYSRQRANFVASPPYTGSNYQNGEIYQLGTGVNVGDIQRIRDDYVDYQMRSNLSEVGYWEKDQQILQRVEAVFPDPVNDSITLHLNEFFNGWQEVNENPLDQGLRVGLLEKGRALATSMNQTYEQLGIVRESLDTEHAVLVSEVERLTERIVQVNDSIAKSYAKNNNVLLDERDLLLDDLAKLVKIEVTPNGDNKDLIDVSVNGNALITGTAGSFNVANFDTVDVGGSVGSVKYAQSQVDKYQDALKNLAGAIAGEINGVYADNRPDGKFFKDQTETLNNNKIIDLAVTNALDIVVGLDDNASGDTQIALKIAQLRNEKIDSLGGITFESSFQDLIVTIGEESKVTGQLLQTHEAINDQLFAQRESVSGVSIDEEMTNLMQYQYGYQASAKVITTIDQMLETLLSIVR